MCTAFWCFRDLLRAVHFVAKHEQLAVSVGVDLFMFVVVVVGCCCGGTGTRGKNFRISYEIVQRTTVFSGFSFCTNMSQPVTYTFHLESKHRDYKARNILTLEDRVAVIREYEKNPVYQRLAEKFNCSSKQIKNIIANKEAVLLYHANRMADGSTSEERRQRQQKIIFLGKVIYEFIQRAVYHGVELDATIVRRKALEVKESIAIMNFFPNNAWMQNFKTQYQLPEFDLMTLRQAMFLDETKEESFKAVDLIQFVSRREKEEDQQSNAALLPPPLKKIKLAIDVIDGDTFDEYVRSDQRNESDGNSNEIGQPTIRYECINDEGDGDGDGDGDGHGDGDGDGDGHGDDYDYMDINEGEAKCPAEEAVNLDAETEDYYQKTSAKFTTLNQRLCSPRNTDEASSLALPDVASYQEALRHLKVLEDYAMLNDNFRAIGLITQLQQVLKDPPRSDDFIA